MKLHNKQITIDTFKFKLLNATKFKAVIDEVKLKLSSIKMGSLIGTIDKGFQFFDVKDLERDTNKSIIYAKHEIGSAFYGIQCTERPQESTFSFEFSLPKYWLGNNAQVFPPMPCTSYADWLDQIKQILNNFFFDKFNIEDGLISFEDIEVERIDLCYNYQFDTQKNMDVYFDYMNDRLANNKNKLVFESEQKYNNASFMYKERAFSFKVYKKGLEFRKHDFPRYLSHKGRAIADKVQTFANNILRFELTFRKKKLNDLFLEHISKIIKIDPVWKSQYKAQKKVYLMSNNQIELLYSALDKYVNYKEISLKDKTIERVTTLYDNIKKEDIKFFNKDSYSIILDVCHKYADLDSQITREDIRNAILTKQCHKIRIEYQKKIKSKPIQMEINKRQKFTNTFNPLVIPFNSKYIEVLMNYFKKWIDYVKPAKKGKVVRIETVFKQNKAEIKESLSINVAPLIKYLMLKRKYPISKVNSEFPKQSRSRWNKQITSITEYFLSKNIILSDSKNQIPEMIDLEII